MDTVAGFCLAVAIVWWPLAWLIRFRAQNTLAWLRSKPNGPGPANLRPLERLAAMSQRMLKLSLVPIVAAVAAVLLLVVAHA